MAGNDGLSWGAPPDTLTLPPFAGPGDPQIRIGPDVPVCMQARYAAVIMFMPANWNSGIGGPPIRYLGIVKTAAPFASNLEWGSLQWDEASVCGYAVLENWNVFDNGAGQMNWIHTFGRVGITGGVGVSYGSLRIHRFDRTTVEIYDDGSYGLVVRDQAVPGDFVFLAGKNGTLIKILLEIMSGATLQIDDGSTVALGTSAGTESDTQGGNITGFTGTTFLTGATACGLSFVAPPSGKVLVHWAGNIETNGTTDLGIISIRVGTGSTLGAGSVELAPDSDWSISSAGLAANLASRAHHGRTRLIDSLTPGDTYNAITQHAMTGATDSGDIFYRELIVQPLIA